MYVGLRYPPHTCCLANPVCTAQTCLTGTQNNADTLLHSFPVMLASELRHATGLRWRIGYAMNPKTSQSLHVGIVHRWEAANGNPALADLYIDTMTALDAIDNRAIYFIEGAGQVAFVTAWGDGFVTDKAIISQNGLSDPTAFFDRLSTMPFLDRVRFPFMEAGA